VRLEGAGGGFGCRLQFVVVAVGFVGGGGRVFPVFRQAGT